MKQRSSFYPWLIWSLAASIFFIQYFPRVAPSIMMPQLMSTFHISGALFGSMSAMYLYAYVPMQIPVGMLMDRFSVRWLLGGTALIAGLGCALFSISDSLWVAQLARFLTGFGAAFGFVGGMKIASLWFSPSKLGLLAGLTQALGMLGAALGEAPVTVFMKQYGWRSTVLVMGVVIVLLAILIFLIVRDKKEDAHKAEVLEKPDFWEGLVIVFKNPQSWINGLYLGLLYAPIMAFAELWGVSFMVHADGISHEAAALADGFMFLGWAIGGPLIGLLSDRIKKRKPLMYLSAALNCFLLLFVIYGTFSTINLSILLFVIGFTNTGVGVGYAVSGEINPRHVAGTSIAFANFCSIVVGMSFEPLVGKLLDMSWDGKLIDKIPYYTVSDYQSALLILPITALAALIVVLFIKETNCKPISK